MKLFCDPHAVVHVLNASQTELVVYALSCEVASALTEPDGDRIHAGTDAMCSIPCPLDYLAMATSPDGFAETTEAWVTARRRTKPSRETAP